MCLRGDMDMKKITPKQLKERLERESVKVLDVRTEEKFELGRLRHKNAENINVFKEDIFRLEKDAEEANLPFTTDQEIVVTCTSSNSARRCTKILSERGYNVTVLDGGMIAWNKENNKL